MLPSIFICGKDPALLLARTLVLERAGFKVESALGLSSLLERGGERLVLCSSLSEAEQTEAIRCARARWPLAKILVVSSEDGDPAETVFKMPIFCRAETFIENARLLLH